MLPHARLRSCLRLFSDGRHVLRKTFVAVRWKTQGGEGRAGSATLFPEPFTLAWLRIEEKRELGWRVKVEMPSLKLRSRAKTGYFEIKKERDLQEGYLPIPPSFPCNCQLLK